MTWRRVALALQLLSLAGMVWIALSQLHQEHAQTRLLRSLVTDLWVPVQGVGLVGVTFAQTPSLETLCARAFGVPVSIFRYPDGSRLAGCYSREFRHVWVVPGDRLSLRHELCHASHGHFHGAAAEDAYRDRPLPPGC